MLSDDVTLALFISISLLCIHGAGFGEDWYIGGADGKVIESHDPFKIILSCFSHVDWIHALVNAASCITLLRDMESHFAATQLLVDTFSIALLASLLTISLQKKIGYDNPNARIKGFSGVLFSFLSMKMHFSQMYCVYSMCFHTYNIWILDSDIRLSFSGAPFAMLFITQALVFHGKVSFVGHLSGIIIGFIFSNVFLQLPSYLHSEFMIFSLSYGCYFAYLIIKQDSALSSTDGCPVFYFIVYLIVSFVSSVIVVAGDIEFNYAYSPTLWGFPVVVTALVYAIVYRKESKFISKQHTLFYSISNTFLSVVFMLHTFNKQLYLLEPIMQILFLSGVYFKFYFRARRSLSIVNGVLIPV